MSWNYNSAPDGNVVQTGRMELTGKPGSQDATLALGFGPSASAALAAAQASVAGGLGTAASWRFAASPGFFAFSSCGAARAGDARPPSG